MRRGLIIAIGFCLLAAAPAQPALTSYVGKYPSTKVAGVNLYKNARFRSAVSAAAPSSGVIDTVLSMNVEVPIERQGALVVAQMCEAHNCTDHQWTVAVLSPNGPAAICYYDAALMGEEARWFIKGQIVGKTRGCWQGEHTPVPDAVVLRLAKTK